MRLIMLLLLSANIGVATSGQHVTPQDDRVVVVPRDQGLIVVVSQPECPLKFEDVKLLVNMKGYWIKSFKLRNQGTMPIRKYTIAAIGSDEWSWEAPDPSLYVMPGETAPAMEAERVEVVSLTKVLREKLKMQGPIKGIVALIVVRLEFADGSVFEEQAYESQKEYFEKLFAVMRSTSQVQ